MTVEGMRDYIANAYPGIGWHIRVANMHEPQVIAIYRNMIERDRRKKHFEKIMKGRKPVTEKCHQISIWEWMKENGK